MGVVDDGSRDAAVAVINESGDAEDMSMSDTLVVNPDSVVSEIAEDSDGDDDVAFNSVVVTDVAEPVVEGCVVGMLASNDVAFSSDCAGESDDCVCAVTVVSVTSNPDISDEGVVTIVVIATTSCSSRVVTSYTIGDDVSVWRVAVDSVICCPLSVDKSIPIVCLNM